LGKRKKEENNIVSHENRKEEGKKNVMSGKPTTNQKSRTKLHNKKPKRRRK
jgi:hypothetical protein